MTPACLVIQHVEAESSFAIGEALAAAGVQIDVRRVHADEPLPVGLVDHDALVVMGGPMSARSDRCFPTRRQELALLAEALELGRPTLGVCLGAQLLASAGGGRVIAGAGAPEIGWAPVRFTTAARDDPLLSAVPATLTVLHWHGDTYDPPPGAVHLGSTASYRHQAFRMGDRAWGLQFHVEVDHTAVVGFVEAFGGEIAAAGTTAAVILAATPDALRQLGPARDAVLERFAALVADGTV